MTFILSAERSEGPVGAFARYRAYLDENRYRFPPGAHALATSGWYLGNADHRAPHDAWLEALTVSEAGTGSRQEKRGGEIRIRLLGAYHDGHVELRYRDVVRYRCELWPRTVNEGTAHQDWRYDEFRLSDEGRLLHEIEWWGPGPTGTWLIEAADVELAWLPFPAAPTDVGTGG